jgi:serine/threonine protein kinase/WD40 repeat protein/tetratricopeptide (TPR) repeat protein
MTTWNPQANEVFLKALELSSSGQREAYLDAACVGDAALRAEVESLLEASARAGGFLECPAANLVATVEDPITERPGTIIGSYKLMEQIGEGGMGLVFVAEQQHPIRRKVALKVIKPGMDTRQVIARFEAERQALALMDHLNIAKVHDGGETASGRPYFVMELVKGVPITEYCDQNQVPIRERLELFIHVCQAVHHAHQKGIIHRDIKPSNVLVMSDDGTPLVKVIDFGVAKAVGQQLTDKTIYTQFTQLVGTPLYMSPEQAGQSGRDVDTRTDIYALGVLLYELLTGTTPFDKERLQEADYEEIRRIIREEEPPRPSTRVTTLGQAATDISSHRKSDPKRLSKMLWGDLDWIVMMALEKDRNRRYESASAFAADVQRYLADEPVQACPPSAMYRFRKYARRNKAGLTIAGMVAAFLVLVAAGSLTAAFWYQRVAYDASEAHRHAEMTLTDMYTTQGIMAGDQGNSPLAVLWFANAARLAHQDSEREYANRVRVRTWSRLVPTPVRALPHPGQTLTHMSFHPQGWHLLTVSKQQKCIVWDLDQERPLPWACGNEPCSCAAWSPDGTWLAMGTPKGEVEIHTFPAGEILHRLVARGPIQALAFSPDGKFLALASEVVRIWDCRTHAFVGAEFVHPKPVRTLVFNSRGDRLVTGCEDDQARVFAIPDDRRGGKPLFDAVPQVSSLVPAFCHQDRWLLSNPPTWTTEDGEKKSSGIDWRDAETGKLLATQDGGSVVVSPDGKHFAAVGYLRGRLGDVARRRFVGQVMPVHTGMTTCVFSPDGRMLLTVNGDDDTGQLWSVPGGERVGPPLPHTTGSVDLAAYSPTGRLFATGQEGGLVRVWRPASPNPRDYRLDVDGAVGGVALSQDGQHLLANGTPLPGYGSSLRSTRVYHVATGKPAGPPLAVDSLGLHAALSPDGQHVVTVSTRDVAAGKAGSLQFWNWQTGEKLFDAVPLPALPDGVVYSPDGKYVVASCRGGEVLVIDPARGRVLRRLHHGSLQLPGVPIMNDFRWAVFSPDGDCFLTGGANAVRVWETTTGKLRYSPLKHDMDCLCAAFSPDGRFLVTGEGGRGDEGRKARVWDVATGQPAAEPLPHPEGVMSACFSPDGQQVLTSSYDGMAHLWDWRSGRLVCPPFKAAFSQCWSSCFTADGRWVLTAAGSGGTEKVFRVWEWRTGKPVTPPHVLRLTDPTAVVTPDGRYAVCAGRSEPALQVLHLGDLHEPGDFSLDELCLLTELLSGHRIHESDVARLTTKEWLDRWRLFRERHPNYFQLEPGDHLAWHRQQADEAEGANQWFAVVWHLDPLIAAEPLEAALRSRRALALLQLREWEKAVVDLSKVIDLKGDGTSVRKHRGMVFAALGQWDKAVVDFATATELNADDSLLWYQYALVRVAANDYEGYRKVCNEMLERFGKLPTQDADFWTTWTCLLAPDAVADYAQPVLLAEKAVTTNPRGFRHLNTLGAVLYRAGRLEEAAKRFTEAKAAFRETPDPRNSIIYTWLFQAMTEHRLGHIQEAKALLAKAVKDIEQPPNGPQDEAASAWNRRLTLQLLRREAETLLGTNVSPDREPELIPPPKEITKD